MSRQPRNIFKSRPAPQENQEPHGQTKVKKPVEEMLRRTSTLLFDRKTFNGNRD